MKPPSFIVNEYRKRLYKRTSLPQGIVTVCEEAKCPNRGECFSKGRITFLLLGDTCTRNCKFCGIKKAKDKLPLPPNDVPTILKAVDMLKINYLVLTSVTRDDLEDGGADIFYNVMNAVRAKYPKIKIEVLVPDFKGNKKNLNKILDLNPFVFNHNLEVVPGIFPQIRPEGNFSLSLEILKYAKTEYPNILIKTGIMVGVGETKEQVFSFIKQAKMVGVDMLTIGQYIPPNNNSFRVARYVELNEYEEYVAIGKQVGLRVIAGPLVRSSYMAEDNVISK